jgi:hypothetical protein
LPAHFEHVDRHLLFARDKFQPQSVFEVGIQAVHVMRILEPFSQTLSSSVVVADEKPTCRY